MSTLMSGAKRVELAGGGAAYVRRLRNSEISKVANAAGEVSARGQLAVQTLMGELTLRLCLVGAEGLKDQATGQDVEFKTDRHPVLGPIAAVAVYDALDSKGMESISVAMGDKEEEDKAGKP